MKIEDIDDIQTQYQALKRAVFHAAKGHLKPTDASYRYARLGNWYVHEGKIEVTIEYGGPYRGTTEVQLLAEEVAFCEPVVKPDAL